MIHAWTQQCMWMHMTQYNFDHHHDHDDHRFMALFRDQPGEAVPEENFWTLWCKGRLTEADTPTIRLGATPTGLTNANLHHPAIFFTGLMPFLLHNQQRQSTEGKTILISCICIFQFVWLTSDKLKYANVNNKITEWIRNNANYITSLNPASGTGAFTGDELPLGGNAFGEVDSVVLVGIRWR